MQSLFETLKEKNVYKVSSDEIENLEQSFKIEKEIDTSMAGPIKVFSLDREEEKLILEIDNKGVGFIRTIASKDVQEFITERLSVYDKMWDGCGCKVFYDEIWNPSQKEKNVEL